MELNIYLQLPVNTGLVIICLSLYSYYISHKSCVYKLSIFLTPIQHLHQFPLHHRTERLPESDCVIEYDHFQFSIYLVFKSKPSSNLFTPFFFPADFSLTE